MSGFNLKTAPIITDPADISTDFVFFGAASQGAQNPLLIRFSALDLGGGVGVTNLSIDNHNADTFDILSSTGTDVTLPAATTTLAGLMTAADKVVLDGIAEGTAISDAPTITPGAGDFIPVLNNDLTPGKTEATYFASAAALTAGLATKAETVDVNNALADKADIDDVNTALALKAAASDVTTALALKLDTTAAPELIRDTMGMTLVPGSGITVTPNDGADTITIASAGGEASQLPPLSGRWLASGSGATSSAIFNVSGRIFYVPLLVPATCTIDRIGVHLQAGSAGTNAKLAIYGSNASRFPGNKIADCAAAISTASSGVAEGTFSSNPTLTAGLYWLAWQSDSTTTTLQPRVITGSALFCMQNSLLTDNTVGQDDLYFIQTGVSYASGLPATATATTGSNLKPPCMSVRVV